jgi:hypothetical protein
MGAFLAIGAAFVAAGLFFGVRTWRFLQRAESTEGTIVAMETHSGSKGPTYSPVVEYAAADGTRHRVTEESSSSHPGVSVGDVVPVKYDPSRPEQGRLAKPFKLWGLPGFFVLLGLVFLVVGLA